MTVLVRQTRIPRALFERACGANERNGTAYVRSRARPHPCIGRWWTAGVLTACEVRVVCRQVCVGEGTTSVRKGTEGRHLCNQCKLVRCSSIPLLSPHSEGLTEPPPGTSYSPDDSGAGGVRRAGADGGWLEHGGGELRGLACERGRGRRQARLAAAAAEPARPAAGSTNARTNSPLQLHAALDPSCPPVDGRIDERHTCVPVCLMCAVGALAARRAARRALLQWARLVVR
jgi:hypothetical protein